MIRGWLIALGFSLMAQACLMACSHVRRIGAVTVGEGKETIPTQIPQAPAPMPHDQDASKWFPNAQRWSAPTIYFYFDQHLLRPSELEKLHEIAAHVYGHCRIEGYASAEGTDTYNLALGYARAMAVNLFLKAAGTKAIADIISFGEEKPITLDPAEAWKNRRVEVVCR